MARILMAKPGLDGHDRGIKVVSLALRDAGFEVIYTGIRQRPAHIASIAVDEDVAAIGLSILSGAHLGLTRKVLAELAVRGAADIPVIVGGTIPAGDVALLREAGAAGVFSTGTTIPDLVQGVRDVIAARAGVPA
ncbi:MAG TPA: cobalamin B12-binding domain-containing protein [Sporichthyaceae bacterium]|jgi:methylmalonyl-CoA mutase C-terminal domain/subunit|nr:cobalamin B12-binding domain-containing protein [Sporichthyaceae bacterium]